MRINIADSWKGVEDIQINIGDTWKNVAGGQINIGDTWKTFWPLPIPANLIIMYDSTVDIPGGSTTWTDADNRHPWGNTTSIGSVGGADTHIGTNHGSGTYKWAIHNANTNAEYRELVTNGHSIKSYRTHQHEGVAGWSHNHTSSGTHAAPWFSLIPTYNVPYIGSGAYFMHSGSMSVGDWTLLTGYVNRYLRFRSIGTSIGTGGSTSHSHAAVGTNSTTYTADLYDDTWLRDVYFYQSHYHALTSPALSTYTNKHNHSYMHFYKYSGAAIYNNEDIPSGVIAYCTTNVVPIGWTNYSDLNSRTSRNTETASGNSDYGTHTHTNAGDSMGSGVGSTAIEYESGSGTGTPNLSGHTRSQDSTHTSTSTNSPRYIYAYPVIKD